MCYTHRFCPLFLLLISLVSAASAQKVQWISSTANDFWHEMPAPSLAPMDEANPPLIRAFPARTYQTIDGFGGCFNELGWEAMKKLSADDRDRVIRSLFGDDGCAFNMARIPIGASDFALDAYSLDDTPEDYELKHFSIDRDRKSLLPYIKAAMQVRPDLQCWGSAWSPPAWMKTNNHYSGGSLRWEPRVLQTYANYLANWVEAYRGEGVHVFAVFTQNEPNIINNYPTCIWTGPQLREFIADYLGPTLHDRKIDVELWLGTLNDGNVNDRSRAVLEDPKANAFVSGVSFQYDGRQQIADVAQLYPGKKLMQSETECHNAANSWEEAEWLYTLMKQYLERGANSYFMWNMVLDETGKSSWDWRQNVMINIDQTSGKATYNGEYYVMRHFSQFIKPGAKRIFTAGPWADKIGFINPDSSLVMVVGNSSKETQPLVLSIAKDGKDRSFSVTLSPHSVNTFVIAGN